MTEPVIVMCAPNGARPMKSDHPNVPVTPAELAQCAVEILEAGASMIHVHARDRDGRHTLDVDDNRRAMDAIRDAVGERLVIQITTEAVGRYSPRDQMALVRAARPEAVSLAVREFCPDPGLSGEFGEFLTWLDEAGILPQFILYDDRDISRMRELARSDLFCQRKIFALMVAKVECDNRGLRRRFFDFRSSLGRLLDMRWALCGFGPMEAEAVHVAIESDAHVRVGFENSLHLFDGRPAARNSDLVKAVCDHIAGSGRFPATAQQARDMLHGQVFGQDTTCSADRPVFSSDDL